MDSAQNQCDQGLRYKDKVVIVTGGSKGIGEGCVRVFGKLSRLLGAYNVSEYRLRAL